MLLLERDCDGEPFGYTLRVYGEWQEAEYETDGPGGTVKQFEEGYIPTKITVSFGGEEYNITSELEHQSQMWKVEEMLGNE